MRCRGGERGREGRVLRLRLRLKPTTLRAIISTGARKAQQQTLTGEDVAIKVCRLERDVVTVLSVARAAVVSSRFGTAAGTERTSLDA